MARNDPFTPKYFGKREPSRTGGYSATFPSHTSSSAFSSHYEPDHLRRNDHVQYASSFTGNQVQEDEALDDFDRELLAQTREQGQASQSAFSSFHEQNPAGRLYQHGQAQALFGRDYPVLSANLPNKTHGNMLSSSDTGHLSSPTRQVAHKRLQRQRHEQTQPYKFVPEWDDSSSNTHADPQQSTSDGRAPNTIRSIGLRAQGIPLVPVSALSDQQASVYTFPIFNAVQSKCFATAYESDDNLVVAAPTGSGKTVIMELAILRLLSNLRDGNVKVVYQAPTKSLCSERYRDWQSRFSPLKLQCAELTGDTETNNLRNIAHANIVVTTPEKWDSVTRKWKDNAKLMELVKLFLVDEVHVLKETRGATIEAVVSRMKSVGSGVRFVALSATVPNSDDVARWLGKNDRHIELPAVREVFTDDFRPVPLERHVLGYSTNNSNAFAFDSLLTDKIPKVIEQYGKGKSVMVFCMTRESAQRTAKLLADTWADTIPHKRTWKASGADVAARDNRLASLVRCGVAFHHASLEVSDRQAVEKAFLQGKISIICSTSTLAVGVNLPCYLVIVKGTSCYTEKGLQEYSILEVTQMLGRAGRPQFEREARAIIMCREELRSRYERLVAGEEVLESSLHQNLIEHLNAEIGLGTIDSPEAAKKWLAGTFLYVRMCKNPTYYGFENLAGSQGIHGHLLQLCEKDLDMLKESLVIEGHEKLRCTEFGDAMAKYCVSFQTMKGFLSMRPKAKVSEILDVVTQAHEFRDFRVRQGDKTVLKEINKATETRYTFKTDLATPKHKVSLLIQARLGCLQLDKLSETTLKGGQVRQFQSDTTSVLSHASRLTRCLVDVLVHKKDSISIKSALELGRSLSAGVWDDSPMQLKQIPNIGDVATRKLVSAGIKTCDDLVNCEAHRIELLLSRNAPFGQKISKDAYAFPRLYVTVKETTKPRKTDAGVEVRLKCTLGFLNEEVPKRFQGKYFRVLFLNEVTDGELLDFRHFSPYQFQKEMTFNTTAIVRRPGLTIRSHVMCDEFAGTHRYADVPVDAPNSWYPVHSARAARTGLSSNNADHIREAIQDFDVDDIDDIDLIEAEGDTTALIAKTSQLQANKTQNATQTTQKIGKSVHGIASSQDTETTQLPNGNWSCQHTCSDRGVDCKHKCCKEGVKRPAKRRKTSTGHAEAAKDAEPLQRPKQGDTTSRSIAVMLKSNTFASTSTPTNTNAAAKVDKLSQQSGIETRPAKYANTGSQSHECRDRLEVFDLVDCNSGNVQATDTDLPLLPNNDFLSSGDLDSHAWDAVDAMVVMSNKPDRPARSKPTPKLSNTNVLHSQTSTVPQSYVSMREVESSPSKMFVSSTTTSPLKSLDCLLLPNDKVNSVDLRALEDDIDQQRGRADTFIFDESLSLGSPNTDDLNAMDHDMAPEKPKTSTASKPATLDSGLLSSFFTPAYIEQQKREAEAWEADQAKRWEQFPAWMKEEFGDIVEIVDEVE